MNEGKFTTCVVCGKSFEWQERDEGLDRIDQPPAACSLSCRKRRTVTVLLTQIARDKIKRDLSEICAEGERKRCQKKREPDAQRLAKALEEVVNDLLRPRDAYDGESCFSVFRFLSLCKKYSDLMSDQKKELEQIKLRRSRLTTRKSVSIKGLSHLQQSEQEQLLASLYNTKLHRSHRFLDGYEGSVTEWLNEMVNRLREKDLLPAGDRSIRKWSVLSIACWLWAVRKEKPNKDEFREWLLLRKPQYAALMAVGFPFMWRNEKIAQKAIDNAAHIFLI